MKILVIGDSCTDTFVYGSCVRLCPEAPIPVFEPSRAVTNDGMGGNVVRNLKSLGVNHVDIITNKEQITKRLVMLKKNQTKCYSEWMVMIGFLTLSILLKLITNLTMQ